MDGLIQRLDNDLKDNHSRILVPIEYIQGLCLFFIHTDLLVQAADYTTNKKRELRDRLLLHCERISSQILTNNMHSLWGKCDNFFLLLL
ncbi:hypothetical protein BON254_01630 [Helicobacter pylori]